MTLCLPSVSQGLVSVAALAAALTAPATFALGQERGAAGPPDTLARTILEAPIYTHPAMVTGSWKAEAMGKEARTLSGTPRVYEIAITASEVSISGPDDTAEPRLFGVVDVRAVESWVEYELRGQGGTFLFTVQFGRRPDGEREGFFVLTPSALSGPIERFAISGTLRVLPQAVAEKVVEPPTVDMPPAKAEPPVSPATPRRVKAGGATVKPGEPLRVTPGELLRNAGRKISPAYPSLARSAGVQGVVLVEIVIDEKGKVADARAIAGPNLLRAEAVRAAREWEFKPFSPAGVPVRAAGTLSFRFSR
jgi:TonB family protein